MVLVPYVPNAARYDDLLSSGGQVGRGSYGRYIGSNSQNGAGFGSVFRSLGRFFSRHIVPIVSKGSSHAIKAYEAAKPSLNLAASAMLEEAGKKAGEKISSILAPVTTEPPVTPQAGTGRRRGRKRGVFAAAGKRGRPGRKILLQRVFPYDRPDAF